MKQGISALVLVLTGLWGSVALAQSLFVQIETHPNLASAQDQARQYAANLPDVNGFRLNSGWYAISLGPYDEAGAIARMNALKAQRAIPPDGFLVHRSAYSQQFYPVGSNALTAPAITTPAPEVAAPLSDALDEALTGTLEQPAVVLAPAVLPEETRREALQSESRLTRQEKFDLQIALKWFGFYNGRIDASFGPGTRGSMAAWQTSKGHEPNGVLTTRQRAELTGEYQAVLASLDLRSLRDETAGIEMDLPQAMVAFDRYDPPFAHFKPINGSGVTVLLISQTGDENTLLGLYDIMQTLEIVPLEGERKRKSNRFTLTGADDRITSYTHAVLDQGEIKGFTLIWPVEEDRRREVALKAMRDSFTPISGTVLPDAYGEGTLEQSIDLISGLQIRRPQSSRSGFYIDSRGTVLTTAAAVEGCSRITLDEIYEAQVAARDAELGLALLKPAESLAPMDYARFRAGVPRLKSEIAVAGYSFEGALGAPTLTFGTLADLKGLQGEETMTRLALAASPGDAGGPVLDTSGSVLGMLLPAGDLGGKRLPAEVSFATDSDAIATFLSGSGHLAAASDRIDPMSVEDLTRQAANLTVLVSCWAN
ncbi:MAG: peptidoglycan-binding protein [Rhodobacteraceae bacterium]|nr:peptidoglycan-binding protein [Paracoccaceae bacterium]